MAIRRTLKYPISATLSGVKPITIIWFSNLRYVTLDTIAIRSTTKYFIFTLMKREIIFSARILLPNSHILKMPVGRLICRKIVPSNRHCECASDFKFKFRCNRISWQKSRLIHLVEPVAAELAQSGGPNYE